jgi:cytochrome c oxidase subunit 1
MHGTLMVFFVISMALVSGFGNLLIPLQIGARDMAYPLLNMLSYWVMVPACIIMLASFFVDHGAAQAGWTAYPPLSALVPAGLGKTLWILGMALFIVSFTMGGLNYISTILNMRAEGMTMMRLPISIWTFFIATILGVLTFPALTAAAIMLLLDGLAQTSFFMPSDLVWSGEPLNHQGGTPILFQHLFWFLGHPEVYVLVLPAIGIAFETIAAFSRRPPFGYKVSVYALLVIAFLSMIVWGHHMFTTGMNPYLSKYFSVTTVMITVPFAVLGVNLIASLWRARIRFTSAMLFGIGTISAIGIGGLGGLFLGTNASDMYFHESYFVVGHFHLMIGTVTFFGVFGGCYYWFPKMFGRKMHEGFGKIHFWLTFLPILTAMVLMHLQGLGHLLRRTWASGYDYQTATTVLHPWITYAALVALGGQVIFLLNFFISAFKGAKAEDNPWQAAGMEWSTKSPPGHGNWHGEVPKVHRWAYEYGREEGRKEDFVLQTEKS